MIGKQTPPSSRKPVSLLLALPCLLILSVSCQSAGPSYPEPSFELIRPEDIEDNDTHFAEFQLREKGYYYKEVLHNAETCDLSLQQFIKFSTMTDGANADSYAGDLSMLIQKIGEDRFVRVLLTVPPETRKSCLNLLVNDNGYYIVPEGIDWQYFKKRYPTITRLWELK